MTDLVRIVPAEKPKSFADVAFTEAEWKEAQKLGPISVFPGTALENIRLSKGLYQFEAPKKQEVDLKIGGMSLHDMSSTELKLTAARLGVTIRKKNIKRSELIGLVQSKLDDIAVEDDDEEVDVEASGDGGPAEE